jgi:hypothetical protein
MEIVLLSDGKISGKSDHQLTRMRVPRFATGLTGIFLGLPTLNPEKSIDQRKPSGNATPDIFSLQSLTKHTKLWMTGAQKCNEWPRT